MSKPIKLTKQPGHLVTRDQDEDEDEDDEAPDDEHDDYDDDEDDDDAGNGNSAVEGHMASNKHIDKSVADRKRTITKTIAKKTRDELFQEIESIRAHMLKNSVTYEPELFTEKIEIDSQKHMKMYLMHAGSLDSKKKNTTAATTPAHPKKKTATTYVGCSITSANLRVMQHNARLTNNRRTEHNANQWSLCMVLFIPETLRSVISTKVLKKYWDTGHGCGKIRLGLVLHNLLELPCHVMSDAVNEVAIQSKKLKLQQIQHIFKPPNVLDINKDFYLPIK